jgi:signal transduction histidine kinase
LRSEELDRAADRFWRSSAHQNVPGSGLGLAIVSQIAARADGRVRLDLPDGGGLRATVELPAEPG